MIRTRARIKTYFVGLQIILEIIKDVVATITLAKYLYEFLRKARTPISLPPKHIDILRVLTHRPLKLTHIMYKANINCSVLKEYVDFLTKRGLVKERTVYVEGLGQTVVYAITQKGNQALRRARELK